MDREGNWTVGLSFIFGFLGFLVTAHSLVIKLFVQKEIILLLSFFMLDHTLLNFALEVSSIHKIRNVIVIVLLFFTLLLLHALIALRQLTQRC